MKIFYFGTQKKFFQNYHLRLFSNEKKSLLITLFLFCSIILLATPANADPEAFTLKGKNIDYTGVYPKHVKTVAIITPASYPAPKTFNKGIELLKAAGLKVKVYPNATKKPENIAKKILMHQFLQNRALKILKQHGAIQEMTSSSVLVEGLELKIQ